MAVVPEQPKSVQAENPFSPLDIHFARLLAKFSKSVETEVTLAASLVSYFRRCGHVCLKLDAFCESPFLPDSGERVDRPQFKHWVAQLRRSRAVGRPGEFRPLILDDRHRLYLHRYWQYEHQLAEAILGRIAPLAIDRGALRDGLKRLFPHPPGSEPDWQKVAAFTAATRRLAIISGGPGTGKTTTILKVLALLLEQSPEARIILTAPTGKAVSRLQESIKSGKQGLDCTAELKNRIPEEASTIHRVLGVVPDSPFFRHDAKNPLAADVVVVDEASMVDLALMTKLFAAIPSNARVILLGDKDQLASVEAGAVLADICGADEENSFSNEFCRDYQEVTGEPLRSVAEQGSRSPLGDCIVQLQKNHRFGDSSPIYRASVAIRTGRFAALEELLSQNAVELQWFPEVRFREEFKALVSSGFRNALTAADPAGALAHFGEFRLLAAVREGQFGITELNRRVERILREQGMIRGNGDWYDGRPVMVTRNDYTVNLFNGDTGVLRRDGDRGMQAYFMSSDNRLRGIFPARLPQHETVFAMTIHKSQGSEFDHVLMVLPDTDMPILTRELIYTGLTRARRKVTLFAREHILRSALARKVERTSGLQEKLWSSPDRVSNSG